MLFRSRKFILTKEMLHEQDYSPWEGHEMLAWPCLTVLRGKVVVEGGNFMGDVKDGRFLPRQISEHIRTGARL